MHATAGARLEQVLRRTWLRRGPLACALWPLAQLYRMAAALNALAYDRGWRATEQLPLPVVVVGNVVAGGAGKTPATLAIVQHLQQRGWKPGIASRGHGRATSDARLVGAHATAREAGDEPLLLWRKSAAPVAVGARRADAARLLLQAHPELDVLVCDDGLQHRALARDVEICVFDARGIGNGWLLPAGPLREPWPRAVDLALLTEPLADSARTTLPPNSVPRMFQARRSLAGYGVQADGTRIALPELRSGPVAAVAAIARPDAFFDMLRAYGFALESATALPDHHSYADVAGLPTTQQTLVCTEKDAVKLWLHRPDAVALPLQLDIPAEFFQALEDLLHLHPPAPAPLNSGASGHPATDATP